MSFNEVQEDQEDGGGGGGCLGGAPAQLLYSLRKNREELSV